jgi:hypothetical protein
MAHKVAVTLPSRELGHSDVSFAVDKDGKLFGTLRVSKGGVDWTPSQKQTSITKTWAELEKFFAATTAASSFKKAARKKSVNADATAPKKITPATRTAAAKKSAVVRKAPVAKKITRPRKSA